MSLEVEKRVLLGCPVYQKPAILKKFLESLERVIQTTIQIDYMFYDDNLEEESSRLLYEFQKKKENVIIVTGNKKIEYVCNETKHLWKYENLKKVTNYKNEMITYAVEKNYEYLFLVDSDLLFHPMLIEHLKSRNKDIVAEIFWTKFEKGNIPLPNVWLYDQYDLIEKEFGEQLTIDESNKRMQNFLQQLSNPGIYPVGGLGACTLISKQVLKAGVNFEWIKNLTLVGEDRYFCIRALVLGFELFVDTQLPAYHIYREEDLLRADAYIQSGIVRECKQHNKLTLSMVVKNECGRYLEQVLRKWKDYIDEAVIINDASTDDTKELIYKVLDGCRIHMICNEQSMFQNEYELRKKQWEETIKTNPDWILNIDADEIFEEAFYPNCKELMNQIQYDVISFPLYDMWNETHYREDTYWNAHKRYFPFLVRYQPHMIYSWRETPQHCGRFPNNIFRLPCANSTFRVKHYGWAKKEDRYQKYNRYKTLDPEALYGVKEQYESILDENPNLIEWKE